MNNYIYLLTYLPTGHRYIGTRKSKLSCEYDLYWGSGKALTRFQKTRPVEDGGWDKRILANNLTEDLMYEMERFYVNVEFINQALVLNGQTGGKWGSKGRIMSNAANKRLGTSKRGNKNCVGRVLSEETKQKIGQANKGNVYGLGYKHTEEAKKKMSNKLKGLQPRLGAKLSKETKRKISKSLKGHKDSNETRKKKSIAQKLIQERKRTT